MAAKPARKPKPALATKSSKKPARRGRRRAKGALAAIGALLLASAVLRGTIGATEAFARQQSAAPGQAPVHASETGYDGAKGHTPDGPQGSAPRIMAEADIVPLIAALDAREARVAKREREIEVRMQALAVAEQEIERKLTALEETESRLRSTLALAQDAAENDIAKLTEVYAKMKPKQAAALFEQMDPEFAAGFLGRMRSDAAAGIMALLPPDVAYTISAVLAGRNADVPKQ